MYTAPEQMLKASEAFIEHVLRLLDISERSKAPSHLMAQWTSGELLLSQTCGYPLMTRLRNQVKVVATPVYDLPGCEDTLHCSYVAVNVEDTRTTLEAFRGAHVVINALDSNSGMNLLRNLVAPLAHKGRFFGEVKVSGAHLSSLELLSHGKTELAAIDCVTWAYMKRYTPERLSRVRVLQRTELTPALPIITAVSRNADETEQIRAALNAVLQEQPDIAQTLSIKRFEAASFDSYDVVLKQRDSAIAAGYPIVA
jgi:ABC-type phosphate/phosphonate transport system substrate-binding protein